MGEIGTKEKILQIAHQLFSQKGFDGVSVRDISNEAGVNVSAISYHFENKENLFKETIRACMNEMSQTVRGLYDKSESCDTNQLALRIYDYFMENSEALKLSFKMFVIDAHIFPQDVNKEDDFIGPPGSKVMYDCILKEKPKAKTEDIVWAVRTIFTQITHKSLLMSSHCVDRVKDMDEKQVKRHLKRVVRVVLADL
ncbi:MAG: TetR family transcriptional regulator [Bacteriovoracaceae bacterium]